ncbi:MAG: hypothetical protein H7Y19_15215 [Luteimonas sp.]|nr:hypothetical protein [Luteimonas sp.]
MSRITAGLLLLCLCCACSKPEPPPTDEPPEPQAEANTELRDAIQAPIERAKAVEQTVQEAADKQRAEIDAQN